MNQKGKVFSLIALSGAMLFSFAIIGKNFDSLSSRRTNAEIIESSVSFSRNDTFKPIGTNKYSVKGRTNNGQDIYCIINCSMSISGSYIVGFPGMFDAVDDTYVSFAFDENGNEPFIFQKINSVKFTNSSSGAIKVCVAEYSDGAYVYGDPQEFASDTAKGISHKANTELRMKGPEKSARQNMTRSSSKIELFYTCDTQYVPPVEHSVSSSPTTNGSISLNKTAYFRDEEVRFNVTPDSGYYVSSVSTSDPDTEVEHHESYYSFVMPDSDIVISATFEEIPVTTYTVSTNDSAHGEIVLDETTYSAGDTVYFMLNIDEGYCVDELYTDLGCTITESDGLYNFTMPASDVEISATYKLIPIPTYSVSLTSYEHGTVVCETGEYKEGDFIELTAEPADGYEIDKVYYNDHVEIEGEEGYYLFEMPAEDVVVHVEFKEHQAGPTREEVLENQGTITFLGTDNDSQADLNFSTLTQSSFTTNRTRYANFTFTYSLRLKENHTYYVDVLSFTAGTKSSFAPKFGVNTIASGTNESNYLTVTFNNDETSILSMKMISSYDYYGDLVTYTLNY